MTYFATISNQIEHTGNKKHLDHGFVTFYANHPLHMVSYTLWGLLQALKAVSLTLLKTIPYAMQNVPYTTHFHKKNKELGKHIGGQVRRNDLTYFDTISNQIEHKGRNNTP